MLSSSFLGQTMKVFNPLLTLAAGAWCPTTVSSQAPSIPSCNATGRWPGFPGIKHVFTFGDSYTTTQFNYTSLPYPSPSNPLGNPAYPGLTSANGPNWVDYFTVKYNRSTLLTYNLGDGGATVDASLVPPVVSWVRSLRAQVVDEFVPGYVRERADAPGAPAWVAEDTLFMIWIGINDVGGSYARGPDGPEGTHALNKRIFAEYAALVEVLHAHGAHNIVFLNVPAIDESPLTAGAGPEAQALEKADLEEFNGLIEAMARNFKAKWPMANVWVYDSYTDFSKVMHEPKSFSQTSGYKNTTAYCPAYEL